MTDDSGVWLYAVTARGDDRGAPAELTGVAGEPLRTLVSGELSAVVGSVPSDVFGEEPLRAHFEDLAWLEATARAHDAVVSAMARRGPLVPLRLATVFRDDDRVLELLDERRADFEAALDLVSGRTEWGVRAYGDRDALRATVAEAADQRGTTTPGAAYLARRRAQLSATESVERDAARCTEEIHARLVEHAAAGRRQPLTDPAVSGRPDWMLLNGTYLVDDDHSDEFTAAVAMLDAAYPGIRLELTGPWPPYSFAGVEREPT
ncbi:GvpL/GvpF family gas vesicle protein [Nocardia arizonensis]|uniref:GvpL/GvpF family gas vesicle protein n=1 Tax=Nocardia arizonensis TaxID=1141647 RepID=UPI0006D0B32D|nr:GvpL/GvpF family gas vesicle protein [Nocardia arizonensis]